VTSTGAIRSRGSPGLRPVTLRHKVSSSPARSAGPPGDGLGPVADLRFG
jgi:hypothetical protein